MITLLLGFRRRSFISRLIRLVRDLFWWLLLLLLLLLLILHLHATLATTTTGTILHATAFVTEGILHIIKVLIVASGHLGLIVDDLVHVHRVLLLHI